MDIKKIINETKFHIDTRKESFTLGDVLELQDQWKAKFTGAVATYVNDEFNKLNSADEDYKTKVSELEKERDALKTEYEKLSSEFEPIKVKMINDSAMNLLKGKVNTGAELAVFEKIKEHLPKDLKVKEEELTKLLEETFESAPYFKPIVVKEEENSDTPFEKKGEDEKQTDTEFEVASHTNFGYNG